ncbi:MAG TPA: glycosyltransferase [Thermoanaerobaculia bacterium]|jgi:glycosyltransferase involved in cell wall biosynthesis|nr:glycosyltransferase [Thermoanaerobaculia bacterium]
MKIAILGTRGVPPNYGGFETFAAELSTRLVARGHEVSVYCREVASSELRVASDWNGVRRIVIPAIRHKYFETVSHAFLSALDALRHDFDAVLVCNAANAFVLPLLRAARIPVAINVDGIERRRRKWNVFGRAVYAIGETFSVAFANRLIADAEVIADYYRENYAFEPVVIPYGSEFPDEEDSDVLQRLQLEPRSYVLYVSRFEPENNPLEVLLATRNSQPATKLVMVGKGLYAKDLVDQLNAQKGPNVLLPGALYDRDYRTLQRNALLYIQATEVGGTHPAMIEAMGSGGAVLAHDTPENREVGGDAVRYFRLRPEENLSSMISELLRNPLEREDFRAKARKRAAEKYSWERVTDAYEQLLRSL